MKWILIACVLMSHIALAQQTPSFKVVTDKDIYSQGDSLFWQCELKGVGNRFNTATVQLWIENVKNGVKWQYRFPLINGYAEGGMKIGKGIGPGRYAFNFLLQADFFNVAGKVSRVKASDTILNYFVLFKDKETILEQIKTNAEGVFNIRGLVFQDTAMITFSKPRSRTDLSVRIITSLDSAFRPVVPPVTRFVDIIDPLAVKDTTGAASKAIKASQEYTFNIADDVKRQQMAEVIVKDRKSNKLLKDYENEYVSGQFRSADEIVIDALSNDDLIQSGNIYNFLTTRVPGLSYSNNPETGNQEFKWRNTAVAIYVDEFRMPDEMPLTVQPGEVAMIKVFRAGSGPLTGGSSNGSSIAIYTKVGPYSQFIPSSDKGSRFLIRGYDGRSIEWN